MPLLLLLMTLLSGASALIYELSWVKLLSLVFGNTTYAVSITVGSFMLGLGLGGAAFGWLVDRTRVSALRWYALLEVSIAGSAFVFPRALEYIESTFLHLAAEQEPQFLMPIRAGLIFALIAVPTFFMGATLPVLCKAWIRDERGIGWGVGLLYGFNTLGAVAGTLLSAFVLMPFMGVEGSVYPAVGVNAVLGLFAFVLSTMGDGVEEKKGDTSVAKIALTAFQIKALRWLSLVFLLTGFTNVAYQVFWTRMLSFFLRSHIFAFASVLAVFLCGLGAGSLVGAIVARRERLCYAALALTVWGVGCLGLISLGPLGIDGLHDYMLELQRSHPPESVIPFATGMILAAARLVLLPTFLMGMQFPLISSLYVSTMDRVGSRVGKLYFANTLGAVAGSLLAGFVMIPAMGMQYGLAAVAAGNLVLALCIVLFQTRHGKAFKFILTALFLASLVPGFEGEFAMGDTGLPTFPRPSVLKDLDTPMILKSRIFKDELRGPQRELLSYEEDVVFSVSVVEDHGGGYRVIYTDNFAATLTADSAKYMRMLGHLPMLMHGSARQALVVCLGTGTTAGSVATHEPEVLDLVDISPAVVRAADTYFSDVNKGVLHKPFTRMHINDGRQFILTSPRDWDVISLEPLLPHTPAAIDFYTRDFYEICRGKLAPGGVMCQWIPVHSMTVDNYRIVLKSFVDAFPYVSLWWFDRSSVILGSEEPILVSEETLRQRMEGAVGEDLADVGLSDPASLLNCYVCGGETLRDFCVDFEAMTDERPVIEFSELYPPSSGSGNELAVMEDFKEMKRLSDSTAMLSDRAAMSQDEINRWENLKQASILCYSGRIAALKGEWGEAYEKVVNALTYAPKDTVAQHLRAQYGSLYHQQAGLAALAHGEILQAIRSTQQAVALQPDSADAHHNYGRVLIAASSRDEPEGIKELQKALELNPRLWLADVELAMTYARRKEFAEAAVHFRKAVATQPNLLTAVHEDTRLAVRDCREQIVTAGHPLPELKEPVGIPTAPTGD